MTIFYVYIAIIHRLSEQMETVILVKIHINDTLFVK